MHGPAFYSRAVSFVLGSVLLLHIEANQQYIAIMHSSSSQQLVVCCRNCTVAAPKLDPSLLLDFLQHPNISNLST
jgi:hypothetical protein